MKIHTIAWLAWLVSGLVILLFTRNPLIILLVNLALLFLQVWISPPSSMTISTSFRFGTSILALSTVLNMFISRFGETVLFQLPSSLPLIGGIYTLEAIVFGLTNGLVLIGIFSLFTILNQVVSVRALVRLIPQAFHPVAVVTTIALTFIPASQKQFQTIKEAQAIRGQELKKIKDWLPLVIPLLIGGLERAMQIAEAMTARGYTSQTDQKPTRIEKLILPLSLVLILLGWVLDLSTLLPFSGWWFILAGLLLLGFLFLISGKRVHKTVYTQENWSSSSTFITLAAILAMVIFLFPTPGSQLLAYDPYPLVKIPEFSILHGISVLTLMSPVLFSKEVGHDPD